MGTYQQKHPHNPYPQPQWHTRHPNGRYSSAINPYSTHYRCPKHQWIPHGECPQGNLGVYCPLCLKGVGGMSKKKRRVWTKARRNRGLQRVQACSEPREVPLTDQEVLVLAGLVDS